MDSGKKLRRRLLLHRIDGKKNPADLMTKHLAHQDLEDFFRHQKFREGRAVKSPDLYVVSEAHEKTKTVAIDYWTDIHGRKRRLHL